jgi:site-specific recombinase XerD
LLAEATETFLEHVKAHSPDKPLTVRRYRQVLEHFERLVGKGKKYVEAITRADIDDYKIRRSEESSGRNGRTIAPRTVNFEVSADVSC